MLSVQTIAILSPGDMGHAVGRALREHGLRVVTCLEGRSDRTQSLSRSAGIENLQDLKQLVKQSDLILSIIPPSEAMELAQRVASAIQATQIKPYFADCNAISPRTASNIDAVITEAGGFFIDASIIGSPPGKGDPPRFYASGNHANIMAQLDRKGIHVHVIGSDVGQASGIKMCYAAWTKGSQALWITLLTAAQMLGLEKELREEFLYSQSGPYKQIAKQIPGISAKAHRWVGEMDEIASTFEQLGLSRHFHQGASDVFRSIANKSLADDTSRSSDKNRTLEQTISVFARYIRDRRNLCRG